ncbi:MAG: DUF4914 family protein [bacterium]
MKNCWKNWNIPDEVKYVLDNAPNVIIPKSREELIDLSVGGKDSLTYDIGYDVEGMGHVHEANVVRCKNGLSVNYPEAYMRRRDPNCMLVNNIEKTDKPRYSDNYKEDFEQLRVETFDWLKDRDIILLPFSAGGKDYGYPALLICPANSAFFAASVCDLSGMMEVRKLDDDFTPKAVIYLAPPFRHTHFEGKQMVIHNNHDGIHEIFSYNLYLGPSAKKGVYGVLLGIGVEENWTTVHASAVKVMTPYDNEVVFIHEGASGSGKSEMLEYAHRKKDGRLLLGRNTVTDEKRYLSLNQSCQLNPVTDDMALCHPSFQKKGGKLAVADAEQSWFMRVNHITKYGIDSNLEQATIHPTQPLIFLNMDGHPKATCLLWEHIEDSPGKRCPNPRVIIPRDCVKGIVDGPVEVDYRSFGIRTPPSTKENPSYAIFGMLHILPPALAWLWRLVAPRGFSNPSILDDGDGLTSEGVGSYWPFATGRKVDHANLMLEQIQNTPDTRHILVPNQHIGAWDVGFMPQWVVREYLARRGQASFNKVTKLKAARSPLGGYILSSMQIEGAVISNKFLDVSEQPEVGIEGYDAGAARLHNFIKSEIKELLIRDLHPLGRGIIQCCLDDGSLDDFEKLMPGKY